MSKQTKKLVGRPTRYRPEFAEQAMKLCLLRAMTDAELAEHFGVSESTLNRWKHDHQEFRESLKAGKELADVAVANSMHRMATGFREKVERPVSGPDGPEVVSFEQYFPPIPVAAIFWLKNRQPAQWRDRQEVQVSNTDAPSREVLDKIYADAMAEAARRDDFALKRAERLRVIHGGKTDPKVSE